MTTPETDALSKTLPGWTLNDRVVAWLWLYLEIRTIVNLDECQLNSQAMRDQIATTLNERPQMRTQLKFQQHRVLLPKESFDWIEEKGRQPKWLATQAERRTGLRLRSAVFRTLSEKQQLIALIDIWDKDFGTKTVAVERLSDAWVQHLQKDNIFKWFKGKDESAKCTLAWEWMNKNKSWLTRNAIPCSSFSELLELFDLINATTEEKELYIEKIKRRWSTQKNRETATDRQQYNFVFTHEVNAILNKLAEKHELSRTKVLQQLLLNEEAHGLYLPLSNPTESAKPTHTDLGGVKSGVKY